MISLPALCLSLAIYHEARGEPTAGQFAVGIVVMNRVASPKFPNDICSVLRQPSQFTYVGDNLSDLPLDPKAWRTAQYIAHQTITYRDKLPTLQNALYFMRASTFPPYARVTKLGRHNFFTES